jgi:hypothetical protein
MMIRGASPGLELHDSRKFRHARGGAPVGSYAPARTICQFKKIHVFFSLYPTPKNYYQVTVVPDLHVW